MMAIDKEELSEMRSELNDKMNWEKNYPKKKLSKKNRFRKLQKIKADSKTMRTCPHCGNSGKGASMFRWHFERCPKKYENILKED